MVGDLEFQQTDKQEGTNAMSEKTMKNTEKIVSLMMGIFNFTKAIKDKDVGGEFLGFLHWGNYPSDSDLGKMRKKMDDVIKLIKQENPQISDLSIYECLLFDLTHKVIWFPKDYPDIEGDYRRVTRELLSYHASSDIDIPIANLQVDCEPIRFGLVTFYGIQDSDRQDEWWKTPKIIEGENRNNDVVSFGRISCPGDAIIALNYAEEMIVKTLIILRALGFPMKSKPNMNFGLINEFFLSETRPYKLTKTIESYRLSYSPRTVQIVGHGTTRCNLRKDILDLIEPSVIAKIQSLIESDLENPSNKFKRKFFLGLNWLGESTKPDTIQSRFAKLAFALEALIGGDANDENLSSIGITASLAERGAFLAGKNYDERWEIHKFITKYYGLRSDIVHGNPTDVSEEDLENFGKIVRKIVYSVADKIDEFNSVKSLQEWILKLRYHEPLALD
jgi:hypothetical protein